MTQTTVVHFYPSVATASSCSDLSGGGCACGPTTGAGTLDPNEAILERASQLTGHFPGRVEVETATYGTKLAVETVTEDLNKALANSGMPYTLSPVNFYTFMESVTPIVVVNGRIRFTRLVPDWEELLQAVEDALVAA